MPYVNLLPKGELKPPRPPAGAAPAAALPGGAPCVRFRDGHDRNGGRRGERGIRHSDTSGRGAGPVSATTPFQLQSKPRAESLVSGGLGRTRHAALGTAAGAAHVGLWPTPPGMRCLRAPRRSPRDGTQQAPVAGEHPERQVLPGTGPCGPFPGQPWGPRGDQKDGQAVTRDAWPRRPSSQSDVLILGLGRLFKALRTQVQNNVSLKGGPGQISARETRQQLLPFP